jgi:hypothetical protein
MLDVHLAGERKGERVESASFDNPFFDEMAKYPIRFSTPVFFGDSPCLELLCGAEKWHGQSCQASR